LCHPLVFEALFPNALGAAGVKWVCV
jgi:hypothetical protein